MLTDAVIVKAKPKAKPWKKADARGLYILIRPDGAKWWRWDFRYGGRRKTLSFGVYPEVKLVEARRRCDEARALLRDGKDPSAARRAAKQAQSPAVGVTFGAVLNEWRDSRVHLLAPATQAKQDGIVGRYLTPAFGRRAIRSIDAPSVLALIRPLERAEKRETAHAVNRIISQVLRYGIATGACDRDCTTDLRGALPPNKATHHAAIVEPKALGALLRAIHAPGSGSMVVDTALRLLPLVFVRPGELRGMEWTELDLDAALWRIPAHRMKMRRPHLVPLSTQALALIREIQPFTGSGRYVFPSFRRARRGVEKPMSPTAMNLALARRGYPFTRQTPHGFRTTASTRLHEMGIDAAHVEMQLAHAPAGVAGVYNQAQYLEQRAAMMQRWADYLDELRLRR